jgi:hypothetical protein
MRKRKVRKQKLNMNQESDESNNECAHILEDFEVSLDLQLFTRTMTMRALSMSKKRNIRDYVV